MPESEAPTGTSMVQKYDPDRDHYWHEEEQDVWDPELGAAAGILQAAGHHKALALLLDVHGLDFSEAWPWGNGYCRNAYLLVPPYLVGRFDQATCDQITEALRRACFRHESEVAGVEPVPLPAPPGWRERLQEELVSGPRNQATLMPLPKQFPRADGMAFRSQAELAVYQILKAEQEARPSDDTFAIFPNCAARVPDRTWEPDFLITYRGRCAAIEVDGGSHRGKYGSDKSRDDILTDSGIAFVKRLDAADVQDQDGVRTLIQRMLSRLERG